MGSTSDWPTMREAARILREAGVEYEARVVSAHRTPQLLFEYASGAHLRGCAASLRVRAAQPIYQGWPRQSVPCLCSACRCVRGRWPDSTPCCRSCKCQRECRWRRFESARRVQPTLHISRSRCSAESSTDKSVISDRESAGLRRVPLAKHRLAKTVSVRRSRARLDVVLGGQPRESVRL